MIRIAFCIIAMLVMVAMLTVVVYAQHVANKDYKDEDNKDYKDEDDEDYKDEDDEDYKDEDDEDDEFD